MMWRLMCAFLFWVSAVHSGFCHHIRGIPHYSYNENYPQSPLFEELRESGDWSLQFTFWEIPAKKALDLAFYAKSIASGEPYTNAVTFQVFSQGEDLAQKKHPFAATINPRNVYKVGWVYEDAGLYIARVTLGEGARAVSEDFLFQVGEPPPNYWFMGGCLGAVLVLVVSVALLKRRMDAAVPAAP